MPFLFKYSDPNLLKFAKKDKYFLLVKDTETFILFFKKYIINFAHCIDKAITL